MKYKRDQILNAARMVFSRGGLEKGKMADIAKEAGVGKGTVYEYFQSKEKLFNAIVTGIVSCFGSEQCGPKWTKS